MKKSKLAAAAGLAAAAALGVALSASEASACPVCNQTKQEAESYKQEDPTVYAMLGLTGLVAGGMIFESLRLVRRAGKKPPTEGGDGGDA